MKTFSGPKSHEPSELQKAQGCLATNLVMPGLGSLAAGRKIGIPQLALCVAGFALTLGFGVHMIYWTLAHWSEYYGPHTETDPFKPLLDLWREARWPILGMLLFGVAWLWSICTSRAIIAEVKRRNAVA
jgi:hypothetical protein